MPLLVALMGFDGSGKTTACQLVETELRRRRFTVRSISGFEHLFLGEVKKFFRVEKLQGLYDSGGSKGLRGWRSLVFKLWPLAVFAECWLSFIFFKFFQPAQVVLFDRYFHDWLISFEKLGYSSSMARFLFLECLPKPDVGIVLVVDPQVAYERKKHDHTDLLAEYEKQLSRYQRLIRREKFKMIDTGKHSAEQVVQEVLKLI